MTIDFLRSNHGYAKQVWPVAHWS